MAAPGYGQATTDQINALKAEVKSLTVNELKNVLRRESLTVSGVKSELQIRLIACMHTQSLTSFPAPRPSSFN
jgi:SAP domain